MPVKNKRLLVLISVLVAAITAACSGTAAVNNGTGQVYQMGIFEDLTTTNYWSFLGSGSDLTIWNAYVLEGKQPTLFTYSDQRFDWVPSLAADFPSDLQEETIDGETFWTTEVDLKEDFKWSDGSDVTAEDFVFTAHTVRDLQMAGNWSSIVNPEYFARAEALDPYKLKIYFKQKPGLAVWQFSLAFMPILPKSYWEPIAAEARQQGDIADQQKFLFAHVPQDPPTAGGFIFNKWEKGAFAEKTRNPDYYFSGSTVTQYANGAYQQVKEDIYTFSAYGDPSGETTLEYTTGPHIESALYNIYTNQEAAVLALKSGEIDFILNPNGLQTGLQGQLRGEQGIELIENPANGFRYLAFNFHRAPGNNKAFRHAVATLVDKEFLTSTVLQGVAIPTYTTVPEGNQFWYNPDVPLIGK